MFIRGLVRSQNSFRRVRGLAELTDLSNAIVLIVSTALLGIKRLLAIRRRRESDVWSIRRPRWPLGTARLQECDELREFVARDAARECRHVVPPVVDPEDQLIFGQSVADPTSI